MRVNVSSVSRYVRVSMCTYMVNVSVHNYVNMYELARVGVYASACACTCVAVQARVGVSAEVVSP